MDKIILAHYINVDDVHTSQIEKYLREVKRNLYHKDDNIIHYFYAVRNQPTKVECINPIFLSLEEMERLKIKSYVSKVCKLHKKILENGDKCKNQ